MPKTFLPLKKRLEKFGYNVLIADVGWTVRDITIHANRLLSFLKDREIILKEKHNKTFDELKNDIIFFGHSMGGLIILEAQRLNPKLNAMRVITCGTPINGTYCAYSALFNKAARQMQPGSQFIKILREDIKVNGRRLKQLKAELDQIVPSASSSLPDYPSQTVPVIGHVSLVFCLPDELLKKI
jgi:pimeloyl-ACP methyl ester carboxylesterase